MQLFDGFKSTLCDFHLLLKCFFHLARAISKILLIGKTCLLQLLRQSNRLRTPRVRMLGNADCSSLMLMQHLKSGLDLTQRLRRLITQCMHLLQSQRSYIVGMLRLLPCSCTLLGSMMSLLPSDYTLLCCIHGSLCHYRCCCCHCCRCCCRPTRTIDIRSLGLLI